MARQMTFWMLRSISARRRLTWLLEMPLIPIALTSSTTERVGMSNQSGADNPRFEMAAAWERGAVSIFETVARRL
jgi:hypothetical protein